MPNLPYILFWSGVFWLAYVYAGYPLLLAITVWMCRVRYVTRDDYLPSVSVLIAARNEEQDIGWKVQEVLRWDYPPDRLEILVASDASEDRTDEIVRSFQHSRVRLVRMAARGGKVRALNQLAQAASGEVLFFTDANAHIERSCLRRMVRHFADERVGCITGRTRSMEDDTTLAVGAGASIYWDYESRVSQLESELGSVLVCDGAIHCARRSLYTSLSPDLANDLELPLRIRSRGYLNLFEPRAVTLESDTSSPREEFARRRRICGQGALGMWQLRGILRGFTAWQFLSRKFLRWLTLVPLLLVLTGSVMMIDLPVFAALTALQLAFYAAALGAFLLTLAGRHTGRVLSLPFYSVLGAVGALSGVVETCLGRRYDLWEVPKASRGQGLIPDEHRSKA